MSDVHFPRVFTKAVRPGTYLRIIVEGDLRGGDVIRVVSRPDHHLSIGDVFRIYVDDHQDAGRILAVPQMSEAWKRWAAKLNAGAIPGDATSGPGCC